MTRCHSSSGKASMSTRSLKVLTSALLTSTSIPPKQARAASTARRIGGAAHIHGDGKRAGKFGRDALGARAVDVCGDDRRAVGGEGDAPSRGRCRRPRDEHDLAAEISAHGKSSRGWRSSTLLRLGLRLIHPLPVRRGRGSAGRRAWRSFPPPEGRGRGGEARHGVGAFRYMLRKLRA